MNTHKTFLRHLKCPECGSEMSEVIDTRRAAGGDGIRRRRRCEKGHRYTTKEAIFNSDQSPDLEVEIEDKIKAHGSDSVRWTCMHLLHQIKQSRALVEMLLTGVS